MSEMPLSDSETKILIVSSQEFATVFVDLVQRAQQSIHAAYFLVHASIYGDTYRVSRKILTSLIAACSRCVQVNLLLGWPSKLQSRTRNLVAAKYFNNHGVKVKIHPGETFHHKFCIFDNSTVLIGSHNLTLGALIRNFEISVAVNDSAVASNMLLLHQRLTKESITFEEIDWALALSENIIENNKAYKQI